MNERPEKSKKCNFIGELTRWGFIYILYFVIKSLVGCFIIVFIFFLIDIEFKKNIIQNGGQDRWKVQFDLKLSMNLRIMEHPPSPPCQIFDQKFISFLFQEILINLKSTKISRFNELVSWGFGPRLGLLFLGLRCQGEKQSK